MECAAKGIGGACSRGPPATRCGLCGAVAYCSKSHQILHWDHHKEECSRLAKQMREIDVLNDFPFTFSKESALLVYGKHKTRCSILTSMGLHHIGLWKSECSCQPPVASSTSSWTFRACRKLEKGRKEIFFSLPCMVCPEAYVHSIKGSTLIIDNWDLPSSLCPCSEPRNPRLTCLSSWKDYYQWRCLPFHSPVALLLHWPLTVYHCFQVSGMQGLISGDTNRVNIHYLGPEKELLQLGVFGELKALFPPNVQLHLDIVGPAVPQFRDGEVINFCNYMHCHEEGCSCKGSLADFSSGFPYGGTSTVTIKLHKGFYHEKYGDIIKDSYPHVVIASNAGVAAYSTWLPTIELLKEKEIPAIFTDFCEEAAHLASRCIGAVTGQAPRMPVQLNPFRQPLAIEDVFLVQVQLNPFRQPLAIEDVFWYRFN